MERTATHEDIVQLHDRMHQLHKDINGFYRFDFAEIENGFRDGIGTPALLLESHSSELQQQGNGQANYNVRDVSFLLLDYAGKADDYDLQNEVLDRTEKICLDLVSLLVHFSKDRNHWLWGMFDINSVRMEKVGPLFDNMYGWNVLYQVKNLQKMCIVPEKWNLPLTP